MKKYPQLKDQEGAEGIGTFRQATELRLTMN